MYTYEITNLTKTYPRQATPANDNLSLTIEQSEVFGLLGDNGAGKTTFVKQIANLLQPSRGQILLFGKPLDHTPQYAAQQIGYMPQGGLALNRATVNEALYFTAHMRGLSRHDSRLERDRLLDLLGIGAFRDRVIPGLSGGQRRLVMLATTLAASPPVLILDEPTNDLDPQNRLRVWDVVRQVNHECGSTIILVTHNVLEAEKVIQRVAILKQGRLIALGRPGVLKADLNQRLRLEIIFTPETPPILPNGAEPYPLAPGRWQVLIERDQASTYLEALHQAPSVEDFRLGTASLEDLYLAMTTVHQS